MHFLFTETIAEVEAELRTFFPFWKQNVDFADSRNRVMDDMVADFHMRVDKRFPYYDESTISYFEIKKNFILALIKDQNNNNKFIGLHRLRVDKPNTLYRKQTEEGLRNLMDIDKMAEHTVDDRCAVCKEKEICLETYKTGR